MKSLRSALQLYNVASIFRLIAFIAGFIFIAIMTLYSGSMLMYSISAIESDDGLEVVFGIFGVLIGGVLFFLMIGFVISLYLLIISHIRSFSRGLKLLREETLDVKQLATQNRLRWITTIIETVFTVILLSMFTQSVTFNIQIFLVIMYMTTCLIFSYIALFIMRSKIKEG